MLPCEFCERSFPVVGRRRFCSDACRQAAYRRRVGRASPCSPSGPGRASVVYECPECEARYVGERRCPDCNLFCRSLGPGGPCPHCDDAVTITELMA